MKIAIPILILFGFIIKYIIKIYFNNLHEIEEKRRLRNEIAKKRNEAIKRENEILINKNNIKYEISSVKKNQEKIINEKRSEIINELNSKLSLSDLLILRSIYLINYSALLNCFEWKYKRLRIIYRDYGICQICRKYSLNNHVHHTYYIKDKLPWEIDDDALLTLCQNCHIKIHQTTEIKVYKLNYNGILEESPNTNCVCTRCNGSGYLPQYDYYENGICFECRGERVKEGVFYYALQKTLNNLNEYNDEMKRHEYKKFVSQIDDSVIESMHKLYLIPTYFDEEEEELPF